jgi:hypothetical protein
VLADRRVIAKDRIRFRLPVAGGAPSEAGV